ncbi:plastocyanin/azurin family copper-binding protein [Fodinibius sediminis]|uniref:Azurin n=1 Tax=Fodinibius sediminis TaxID=1214077 RepID=A0A521BM41_9BACT|nr:plastocyanin/azurin family copper-binding protein [Fodinibius sediminis]SMO47851.1 azurin [Fodinibius sediminis]
MRYLIYLLPLMFFITACGGGSSEQEQQAESTATEAQSSADQSSDVRTIEITGVDQMKFVVEGEAEGITIGDPVAGGMPLLETITASPGEEIRIVLTTESDLPASAMAHNFVLMTMEADVQAFVNAASKARDNEYIPSDMSDQIIAHTDLAAGGETVEVTFTAPEETGEYEFICSFPGHYAAGMKGILKVE